jgi:hypothetical protein
VIVPGIFDLESFVPNVFQLLMYYFKYDANLYKFFGRFFDIPDSVTTHYQVHNLAGVRRKPIVLNEPNRLVYSAHLYPFYYLGSKLPWNDTNPTFQEYDDTLRKYWGYVFKEQQVPVWVGEMGNDAADHGLSNAWLNYTIRYLQKYDLDFAYWPLGDARPQIDSLTGHFITGSDDYGLLNSNFTALKYPPLYESIKPLFQSRLKP